MKFKSGITLEEITNKKNGSEVFSATDPYMLKYKLEYLFGEDKFTEQEVDHLWEMFVNEGLVEIVE